MSKYYVILHINGKGLTSKMTHFDTRNAESQAEAEHKAAAESCPQGASDPDYPLLLQRLTAYSVPWF